MPGGAFVVKKRLLFCFWLVLLLKLGKQNRKHDSFLSFLGNQKRKQTHCRNGTLETSRTGGFNRRISPLGASLVPWFLLAINIRVLPSYCIISCIASIFGGTKRIRSIDMLSSGGHLRAWSKMTRDRGQWLLFAPKREADKEVANKNTDLSIGSSTIYNIASVLSMSCIIRL